MLIHRRHPGHVAELSCHPGKISFSPEIPFNRLFHIFIQVIPDVDTDQLAKLTADHVLLSKLIFQWRLSRNGEREYVYKGNNHRCMAAEAIDFL